MIATFLCLDYVAADNRRFLWIAFFLLPLALVFDVLDGYVARPNRTRQSRSVRSPGTPWSRGLNSSHPI